MIAERYTFKGLENYFTDSLLYQDSLDTDENPQQEELDSGNEADVKPERRRMFLEAEFTCNEH